MTPKKRYNNNTFFSKEGRTMKAEHINLVLEATQSVLENMVGLKPDKGALDAKDNHFFAEKVISYIGVTGELEGFIYFSMDEATAREVAGEMAGMELEDFNEMARSAVGELANIIIGQATTNLSDQGHQCDITPPSITTGNNLDTSIDYGKFLVIPLHTDLGIIQLNVSLQKD